MCCELSGGHFAEDRRTFCRKKADILPNMGGHFVEWWTFCRSPRARVRSFRSPASPTRGLAVLQPGEEGRQRRSQARRSGQRVPHRGHPAAFSCPAGGRRSGKTNEDPGKVLRNVSFQGTVRGGSGDARGGVGRFRGDSGRGGAELSRQDGRMSRQDVRADGMPRAGRNQESAL